MLIYPAIFTREDEGYWVKFPDLEGCLTEGENMQNTVEMAEEALGGYIASIYERKLPIPAASDVRSIKTGKDEYVVMIYSNADKYFKNAKAVKKTLTIPAWLNDIADSNNVNYSSVLQEALKQKLNIV